MRKSKPRVFAGAKFYVLGTFLTILSTLLLTQCGGGDDSSTDVGEDGYFQGPADEPALSPRW